MGDFLETRASPSAGAAYERSVGVPWEHDFEQKVSKMGVLLEPLYMLLRAALAGPGPRPEARLPLPSGPVVWLPLPSGPVVWPQAGANLGEARLVKILEN